MSDRKFTDDEVIKAAECCNDDGSCDNCPFDGVRKEDAWCVDVLNEATRNLINRQKAEIERLYKEIGRISKMTVETNVKEMTEGGGSDA